jgi:hypothetical protein
MSRSSQPLIAIIPALPKPPDSLPADARNYANQLVKALEDYIRLQTGTPLLRGSGLFLPGLPTSEYGLPPDMVFSNNGVLTLVRANAAVVTGSAAVSALGHVTTHT